MAGAVVQWGKPGMQEQGAEESQEQREPKGGEQMEPCPRIPGQAPSDAGTALQEAHQWEC